jgi:penicillin-binding protein 2
VTALVLSNNPFMYQIAATREPRIGAARLCDMARRFGYGSTTGLPLPDKAGNVPTEAWMHRNYGRGFMAGDAANLSIGQGALLATPLQVAHAVAGIANGSYLPKLQLIRQVLDKEGNVVFQFTPTAQTNLQDMSSSLAVVRKGMKAVVNGGTGRRAKLSYVSNAGKTGTAQWGPPSQDCRLAWFTGFLPADNPRYAYAALYEGKPHQRISGGHMAAMVVKSFFESIKPSLLEELEGPTRRANTPGGAAPEEEDVAEPVETEDTAEEVESQEAENERLRREAEKRRSPSGWDDGRSRN